MAEPVYVINGKGRPIFYDPDDQRGVQLAASQGNLNPESLRLWNKALALFSWELVIDVGCNYGEMLVSADLPDGCKLIAFEPNPRVLLHLKRTLSAFSRPIDLQEYAVSATTMSQTSFVVDEDWSGTSALPSRSDTLVFGHDHRRSTISVPVTTLDHAIKGMSAKNACIKIDVEGYEDDVLKGASQLLGQLTQWVVMLETLHFNKDQWLSLANRYNVYLLDKRSHSLVLISGGQQAQTLAMLSEERYYLQDALLVSDHTLVDACRPLPEALETWGSIRTSARRVVYTALIGKYEQLNEQPFAAMSGIDFICFTDDPDLTSSSWMIRQIQPRFPRDPIRSARFLKTCGTQFLTDYDESLWIDNSIILTSPSSHIFDSWMAGSDFAAPLHSYRETVAAEFDEVDQLGLDEPARIYEQLIVYSALNPDVLREQPLWTAMLARRHTPKVQASMALWYEHILRYSRRDQLSINFILAQTGLPVTGIAIDNFGSAFHTWPNIVQRCREVSLSGIGDALRFPVADIGRMQNKMTKQRSELQAANQKLLQLRTELDVKDGAVQEQSRQIFTQQLRLEQLNDELTALQPRVDQLEQKVAIGKVETSRLDTLLKREQQRGFEIDLSYRQSVSWTLTAPLRCVFRWLSGRKE